jgi:hypothetical protein
MDAISTNKAVTYTITNATVNFSDGKIFNGSMKNNKPFEGTLTPMDKTVRGYFNDDGDFVIKF